MHAPPTLQQSTAHNHGRCRQYLFIKSCGAAKMASDRPSPTPFEAVRPQAHAHFSDATAHTPATSHIFQARLTLLAGVPPAGTAVPPAAVPLPAMCVTHDAPASTTIAPPSSGYFTSDRLAKYGYGCPRLLALTLAAFATPAASVSHAALLTFPALGSLDAVAAACMSMCGIRWAVPAFVGALGAVVNVCALPTAANFFFLALSARLVVGHAHTYGGAVVIYLAKTFAGDFLAGKLDTKEWLSVLLFTAALTGFALATQLVAVATYGRIFVFLFIIQTICELGDAHAEHLKVFRHRYAFEVLTAALLLGGSLSDEELGVVRTDLVACLFYRLANFVLCLLNSTELWVSARKLCFVLFGAMRGTPMQNVTDPHLAMAVLRNSDEKGAALERYVASPAWLPLVSLESIDGPLYKDMVADLHALVAALPPPSALQVISQRRAEATAAAASRSGTVIDAHVVACHVMACILEYLFGCEPAQGDVDIMVQSSWEWRKEIAVRGPGDMGIKKAAVSCLLRLLRANKALWALHGDKWLLSRYHSLLMQPFLISPCINAGDICVTVAQKPQLPLDDAIRTAHPFPIFERVAKSDIRMPGSSGVAVKAGTHVIIFTSDLSAQDATWPVFGAGPRACAGTSLALALLRPMHTAWSALGEKAFQPAKGHLYSGRHNDGNVSFREALYFMRVIGAVVLFAKGQGVAEDQAVRPADE